MPNKGHGDMPSFVIRHLKRKDHDHMINHLLDLLHPPCPPCPYLRTNVIHDRDTQFPGHRGNAQVKVGKINNNKKSRAESSQVFLSNPECTEKDSKLWKGLGNPNNSYLRIINSYANACLSKEIATYAKKLEPRVKLLHCLHKTCTVHVAGGFSGNNHDFLCCAHHLPVK